MKKSKILIKTLVYGYGDVKNHDAGLGKEIVGRLNTWMSDNFIFDVDLKSSTHLTLDDIEIISNYTRVIFVEATKNENDLCELKKVKTIKIKYTSE